MSPTLRSRSARLTGTACVALLLAGGCVSKDQFSHVSSDRDRLSTELSLSQGEGAALRQQNEQLRSDLQGEHAQLAGSQARAGGIETRLGEVQTALTAAQKDQAESKLTRQKLSQAEQAGDEARRQIVQSKAQATGLAASLATLTADADALRKTNRAQAARIEVGTAEIQSARAATAKEHADVEQAGRRAAALDAARADLQEKLAASQKQVADGTAKLAAATADLSKLQKESQRQVADANARVAEAKSALAAAQKDQADLKATRQKLSQAEQAANESKGKLTQAERRLSELEQKVANQANAAKQAAATDAGKVTSLVEPSGQAD